MLDRSRTLFKVGYYVISKCHIVSKATRFEPGFLLEFLVAGKQLLVAAHQESAQCVTLWDVNSSAVLHKLPVAEPVLDVAPLRVNGVPYLAALSDKHVRFYKWT